MLNRKDKSEKSDESMFDRKFRLQRMAKFAENEGLFFGITVLFALYATQGMFTIQ